MSLIVISGNEIINPDVFLSNIEFVDDKRKWYIYNDDYTDEEDVRFQLKNCSVKYTPEKYDKITIDINNEAKEFFKKFEKVIKEVVDIEPILKDMSIGLKMSKEQKIMCKNSLTRGDYINIVIKFNNIWTVNKKKYVSLELLQFKKIQAPTPEYVNYFVDDDDEIV